MKKLAILLMITSALFAGVVNINTSRSAVGKGIAPSYEQAVQKALADALTKLNGAKLKSISSLNVSDVATNDGSRFESNFNEKIAQITSGRFDGYEIISENQGADGYEVELQITKRSSKKIYKAPGQKTNKNNLVIVTSFDDLDVKRFGQKPLVAAHDLHQALSNEIYKARKFRLLDRSDVNNHLKKEESFIKERANLDESLRLGQNLGADYLLIYEVTRMGLKKGEKSKFSSATSASELELVAKVRVVLLSSAEIKYSTSVDFIRSYKNLDTRAYEDFIAQAAAHISAQLHSGIFPPKIEQMQNGLAVFTQKLAQDAELECFALGAVITDSRTGEKSRLESPVASVKIIRVNEKQSYGKVLDGAVKKGNICRLKELANPSDIQSGSGEFVPESYGAGF